MPPGQGCSQLPLGRCDGPAGKGLLYSNQRASRRTKQALQAFTIYFGDPFPAAETC